MNTEYRKIDWSKLPQNPEEKTFVGNCCDSITFFDEYGNIVEVKHYGNKQEKEIAPEWISESGQKTIWDYCTKVLEPYLS